MHILAIAFFLFSVFYCQTLRFLSFGLLAFVAPTFQHVVEETQKSIRLVNF